MTNRLACMFFSGCQRLLLKGKSGKGFTSSLLLARFLSEDSNGNPVFTHKIDHNLEVRSPEPLTSVPHERPLVILFGWLLIRAKHLNKIGDIYLNKGCDVLNIQVKPNQILFPKNAKAIVHKVLNYIEFERHRQQPLLVHGFSVGGYLYGELLNKLNKQPELFNGVRERLKGQVFDSPVDFAGIPFGISRVIADRAFVQNMIQYTLELYLRLFSESITKHYLIASDAFKQNYMKVPSLVLYSKADPVAMPSAIDEVVKKWTDMGIPTYWRCWDNSPHVSHMLLYPDEYMESLFDFLQEIGIIEYVQELEKGAAADDVANKIAEQN